MKSFNSRERVRNSILCGLDFHVDLGWILKPELIWCVPTLALQKEAVLTCDLILDYLFVRAGGLVHLYPQPGGLGEFAYLTAGEDLPTRTLTSWSSRRLSTLSGG